jgi:hypothetical protein
MDRVITVRYDDDRGCAVTEQVDRIGEPETGPPDDLPVGGSISAIAESAA